MQWQVIQIRRDSITISVDGYSAKHNSSSQKQLPFKETERSTAMANNFNINYTKSDNILYPIPQEHNDTISQKKSYKSRFDVYKWLQFLTLPKLQFVTLPTSQSMKHQLLAVASELLLLLIVFLDCSNVSCQLIDMSYDTSGMADADNQIQFNNQKSQLDYPIYELDETHSLNENTKPELNLETLLANTRNRLANLDYERESENLHKDDLIKHQVDFSKLSSNLKEDDIDTLDSKQLSQSVSPKESASTPSLSGRTNSQQATSNDQIQGLESQSSAPSPVISMAPGGSLDASSANAIAGALINALTSSVGLNQSTNSAPQHLSQSFGSSLINTLLKQSPTAHHYSRPLSISSASSYYPISSQTQVKPNVGQNFAYDTDTNTFSATIDVPDSLANKTRSPLILTALKAMPIKLGVVAWKLIKLLAMKKIYRAHHPKIGEVIFESEMSDSMPSISKFFGSNSGSGLHEHITPKQRFNAKKLSKLGHSAFNQHKSKDDIDYMSPNQDNWHASANSISNSYEPVSDQMHLFPRQILPQSYSAAAAAATAATATAAAALHTHWLQQQQEALEAVIQESIATNSSPKETTTRNRTMRHLKSSTHPPQIQQSVTSDWPTNLPRFLPFNAPLPTPNINQMPPSFLYQNLLESAAMQHPLKFPLPSAPDLFNYEPSPSIGLMAPPPMFDSNFNPSLQFQHRELANNFNYNHIPSLINHHHRISPRNSSPSNVSRHQLSKDQLGTYFDEDSPQHESSRFDFNQATPTKLDSTSSDLQKNILATNNMQGSKT